MPPTPTQPNRVRYESPSRDPNIPRTMRVTVEIGYVRGCSDCETIVATIARSCIPDPNCTSFKAIPGRAHAHDVADGPQALPGLTDAPTGSPEAAQGTSGEADEADLPISDTNGYHPDLVTIASEGLNGFDYEGRA